MTEEATATPVDAVAPVQTAPTRRSRLEEEGDVAADYLEELLDIADLDGDIDIDVENERAAVSIVGDDGVAARSLRRLVGDDGDVLDALQELTRLAVQTKTGERSRLMLDVAGFRASRKHELEQTAREAIAQVQSSGEPERMEPMTAFERKVIHDVVAAAGLVSESEGEGAQRRVVISPAAGSSSASAASATAAVAEPTGSGVEDSAVSDSVDGGAGDAAATDPDPQATPTETA